MRTLRGHEKTVSGVVFYAPSALASSSRDGKVRLWDAETGRCARTLGGGEEWVRCVAASGDARQLLAACGHDKVVRVWALGDESAGDAPLAALAGHEHVVEAVAFAPALFRDALVDGAAPGDEAFVASAARDATVRVWNVGTGECLAVLAEHAGWVRRVAFLGPAGKHLVSASDDGAVKVWDLGPARRCVRTLEAAHGKAFVGALAVGVGGALMATGGDDKVVRLWDLR